MKHTIDTHDNSHGTTATCSCGWGVPCDDDCGGRYGYKYEEEV